LRTKVKTLFNEKKRQDGKAYFCTKMPGAKKNIINVVSYLLFYRQIDCATRKSFTNKSSANQNS